MKIFTTKKNNCPYLYCFPYMCSNTLLLSPEATVTCSICLDFGWHAAERKNSIAISQKLIQDFVPNSRHKIPHATGWPKDLQLLDIFPWDTHNFRLRSLLIEIKIAIITDSKHLGKLEWVYFLDIWCFKIPPGLLVVCTLNVCRHGRGIKFSDIL
jgi:hypothetical protein